MTASAPSLTPLPPPLYNRPPLPSRSPRAPAPLPPPPSPLRPPNPPLLPPRNVFRAVSCNFTGWPTFSLTHRLPWGVAARAAAVVRLLILSGCERNLQIEEAVPEDRREAFQVVLDTTLWGRGVANPVADGAC
jgi:hypothetical protein